MNNRGKILLTAAAAAGLLLGGCIPGQGITDMTTTARQLVTVERGDLVVSVSGTGSLEVADDAALAFDDGGRVSQVTVEEGDEVVAGETLAVVEPVDPDPLKLAVGQAEAALMQAEYNLDQVVNPFTDEEIEEAEEAVDDAEDYRCLAIDMLRYVMIHGSEREVHEWQIEVFNAEVQLEMAEDTLDDMLNERDEDQIAILTKQVYLAEESLTAAQDALLPEYLTAPFNGVVAGVNVEVGDIIPAAGVSQLAAVYLIDSKHLELVVRLDEIDTPNVRVGQSALIEFDAVPDLMVEGEVISISPLPAVEAGVVLYNVRVNFEIPPDAGLRAGMSATADIIQQRRFDVLLVPARAVSYDTAGNAFVRVGAANESGDTLEIIDRPVTVGISDGYQTEITSGVDEGEMVVLEDTPQSSQENSGFFGG